MWRLTLDQDLLDTLTRRFPSWFDNLSSTSGDSFQTSAEKYFTVNLADINGMAEGLSFDFNYMRRVIRKIRMS